ncbi:MAG TPA: glycine cleavage T C-terminal barrel domain-containing protein [Ornithinimicrobium sp.]|uniref:glycine cleavage T C-terminal barrel domain-containing protein n=1 Tax=Ornithinimicrobium sp. TaxID=1977084 RepID=UPI002B47FFDC|nr:glycine cleavage T C-terminal barrel domain-containing protein [Ornithinimicrobium sp.]HKJ10868.1 glycine cleavage T C-terminal barrel domain-containing protein [Ornithinimicrobium sp.]
MLLYPRIRRSPFFEAVRQHGVAMYSVYNHMYIPRHFGDPVAEYWNLLTNVNLTDVGVQRPVEITGPDAFTFTNRIVTRDLSKCEVGQCKYTFLTDEQGGIINDPVLLRLGENHFWLTLADSDGLLWAKGLAVNSGLDVTLTEPDMGTIQVQGPRSIDVMTDVFGESIRDIGFYRFAEYTLDEMSLIVSRTGYTSELGFEVYLSQATEYGPALWRRLYAAGQPHGVGVGGVCHIRRIEGGMLAYGADVDLSTNPYEVGLGYPWMVALDKEGGFVGDEALRRIRAEGTARRLVGMVIDGAPLGSYNDGTMVAPYPVVREGGTLGRMMSACHSPQLQQNIGMVILPTEDADPGTEHEVVIDGEPRRAVVTEMPFTGRRTGKP